MTAAPIDETPRDIATVAQIGADLARSRADRTFTMICADPQPTPEVALTASSEQIGIAVATIVRFCRACGFTESTISRVASPMPAIYDARLKELCAMSVLTTATH